MSEESIVVSVLKFEELNPQKKVKKPTWFRFQHDLFEDARFFDFSDAEIKVWIYLLCRASKEGATGKVTLNLEHAHRVGRISAENLHRALKKLTSKRIVTTHSHAGRFETFRDKLPTGHYRTLQDKT